MLYTFAPEDPIDWNPDFSFNVPTFPVASSSHREIHIPIAKSTRRREQSPTFALPPVPPLESSSPTPHYTHVIRPSPFDGVSSQPRIPRPPNAFMLFRSDFLKRGVIPDNVERRQQNLSRIAGEMWNLLDPVEKEKWHGEAARALAEHQRKNPGYKFTPSPRGSRLARIKARGDVGGMGEDDIRRIRETYTNLTGPAPVSNRRRRQKKAKSVEAQSCTPGPSSLVQQPVLACYPLAQPEELLPRPPNSFMNPSPPHLNPLQRSSPTFVSPFYSVDSFPRATLPRRPSTSLGFVEQPKESRFVERDGKVAGSIKASPSSPLPARTNNFLTFVFDHGEAISAVSVSIFHHLILRPTSHNEISLLPRSQPAPPLRITLLLLGRYQQIISTWIHNLQSHPRPPLTSERKHHLHLFATQPHLLTILQEVTFTP